MKERFILAHTLSVQSVMGRKHGSKSKLYLLQQEHGVTGHVSIVRKQGMPVLRSLSPLSFSLWPHPRGGVTHIQGIFFSSVRPP